MNGRVCVCWWVYELVYGCRCVCVRLCECEGVYMGVDMCMIRCVGVYMSGSVDVSMS